MGVKEKVIQDIVTQDAVARGSAVGRSGVKRTGIKWTGVKQTGLKPVVPRIQASRQRVAAFLIFSTVALGLLAFASGLASGVSSAGGSSHRVAPRLSHGGPCSISVLSCDAEYAPFNIAPSASRTPESTPAVLISPDTPALGETFRVLAALDSASEGLRFRVKGPAGSLRPLKELSGGGPPFWKASFFRVDAAGSHIVEVELAGRGAALEKRFEARPRPEIRPSPDRPEMGSWGRAEENLYSAWVEALFLDADERSSWDALHDVIRDAGRNLLHDHLGLGEDDARSPLAPEMTPDCADNPYFLRAYFAWKMNLPFGFHECGRGSLTSPPRTGRWFTNAGPEALARGDRDPARAFKRLLPAVKNVVHAGSGRTALDDSTSDYYPVGMTRESLRPGVVFADPYGHTLVIVRWVPQTRDKPGRLLAVDAQPDGTIGIKRFWRGNFLFATDGVVGEPGFKAFRPIAVSGGGRLRLLTNEEIAADPGYGGVSLEARSLAPEKFYAVMESLINPKPLDPVTELRDLFEALHEQLIVRVESVDNGEKYMRAHPGTVIPMPSGGAAVFQTMGLWEDYSTPNRDLRLLIAMDAVKGFVDKVAREPQRYGVKPGRAAEETRRRLESLADRWSKEMKITYSRSDGSAWELTLEEIFRREEAFEMGYNPNDSAELRWGAPPGSEEARTVARRAPASQRARMEALRVWFKKRLHPPT
jgi:hypothetical protein